MYKKANKSQEWAKSIEDLTPQIFPLDTFGQRKTSQCTTSCYRQHSKHELNLKFCQKRIMKTVTYIRKMFAFTCFWSGRIFKDPSSKRKTYSCSSSIQCFPLCNICWHWWIKVMIMKRSKVMVLLVTDIILVKNNIVYNEPNLSEYLFFEINKLKQSAWQNFWF